MEDIQSAVADVKEDMQPAGTESKPSQEDLLAALRAAKDLIDSLREYNGNLATSVEDQKDQIEMLKEKLYETNVPDASEDKAIQKAKLQAWLAEAAAEKKAKLETAMLAVENRNLTYELEILKTPTKQALSKTGAKVMPSSRASAWLHMLGAGAVGLVLGVFIGRAVSNE